MDWIQQLFFLPADQIPWWAEVVRSVLRLLIGVIGALGSVPFLVWWERRLLGGLRASSQVISYELGMGLSIIAVLLMCGTLGTQNLVMGYDPAAPHALRTGMELTNGQGHILVNPIANSTAYVVEQTWFTGFW